MTTRVSIVTTVYDRVADLARCLRSVQHLVYPDVEQIVVSDAPPPAVVAAIVPLCLQAGVQYLNLPTRAHDWGSTPAAVGLRAAQGAYVCFLSDDNAYLPDHFGPLVAALDADPDLGFVYSSCLYAGRKELRYAPPIGAGIDLGQPLFRRSVLGADIPFHEHAWDWRLIGSLVARGVRWQHVDVASFVFKLTAYPQHLAALA